MQAAEEKNSANHLKVGVVSGPEFNIAQAGLISTRDGLFVEDKNSPYVNLVVAREDNKSDEKVNKFVAAYQSVEVEQAAEKEFKDGAIKSW